MSFWKLWIRPKPKKVYTEMMLERAHSLQRVVHEVPLAQESVPFLAVVAYSGCSAAAFITGLDDELRRHWQGSTQRQHIAMAEACAGAVLAYMSVIQSMRGDSLPASEFRKWADALDGIFDRSLPAAADLATCLYIQKLRDDADALQRQEAGKPPRVSLLATAIAVKTAAYALGQSRAPMQPILSRFPVSDHRSLEEAGIAPTLWDSRLELNLAYHAALTGRAVANAKFISTLSGSNLPPEYYYTDLVPDLLQADARAEAGKGPP